MTYVAAAALERDGAAVLTEAAIPTRRARPQHDHLDSRSPRRNLTAVIAQVPPAPRNADVRRLGEFRLAPQTTTTPPIHLQRRAGASTVHHHKRRSRRQAASLTFTGETIASALQVDGHVHHTLTTRQRHRRFNVESSPRLPRRHDIRALPRRRRDAGPTRTATAADTGPVAAADLDRRAQGDAAAGRQWWRPLRGHQAGDLGGAPTRNATATDVLTTIVANTVDLHHNSPLRAEPARVPDPRRRT